MHTPETEQIQSTPGPVTVPGQLRAAPDQPRHEGDKLPRPVKSFPDVTFGALVGLFVGAPVGAATCALLGLDEYCWPGALFGVALGALVGGLFGIWKRKRAIDRASWDVATYLCIAYGLVPALILFVTENVQYLMEAVWLGPLAGLMVGALFDRAREALFRNTPWRALRLGALAVAGCLGLLLVAPWLPYGPEPARLTQAVRSDLLREFEKDARVDVSTLKRDSGPRYSGTVRVTAGGHTEQFRVAVKLLDYRGWAGNWSVQYSYTLTPAE
jgi:hypothetical protein